MAGREITPGVVNDVDPEFDPVPHMDLMDWVSVLEFPEERGDLLDRMPEDVRRKLVEMGLM